MPTDLKIDYIELPAADFDAVEAFYTTALGDVPEEVETLPGIRPRAVG